jgi:hypothetical protein
MLMYPLLAKERTVTHHYTAITAFMARINGIDKKIDKQIHSRYYYNILNSAV